VVRAPCVKLDCPTQLSNPKADSHETNGLGGQRNGVQASPSEVRLVLGGSSPQKMWGRGRDQGRSHFTKNLKLNKTKGILNESGTGEFEI